MAPLNHPLHFFMLLNPDFPQNQFVSLPCEEQPKDRYIKGTLVLRKKVATVPKDGLHIWPEDVKPQYQ